MYKLYKLGIRFFYFLLWAISPFNSRASEWCRNRRIQKLELDKHNPGSRPVAWFHASSLGEFEQAVPLINSWKKSRPDHFILLTFYSSSGYKIRKNFQGADSVMYLPRDLVSEIRPFIDHFNPFVVILIKYEIWPVLLRELSYRKISTYLVSAVFKSDQLFFKWYGGFFLSLLNLFSEIFVQDKESEQLLKEKGIGNITIAGDTRIDQVIKLAEDDSHIEGIEKFVGDNKIIIAGSSWQKEEQFLHRFVTENNPPDVKIILAPHDISPGHLSSIEELFGNDLIKYDDLLNQSFTENDKKVLLINRIGLLSKLYRYGHIAFIGGAFGAGLHNVLEPAVYGLPVIFGPRYDFFIEAVELVNNKAGFSISSYSEFQAIIQKLINDDLALSNAGKGCRSFVNNNKGATDLIISRLLENA